jgi:hypothetical protein
MLTKNRFGRKIKMPSTIAIKHQVMTLMLHDLSKTEGLEATAAHSVDAEGRTSPAIVTPAV